MRKGRSPGPPGGHRVQSSRRARSSRLVRSSRRARYLWGLAAALVLIGAGGYVATRPGDTPAQRRGNAMAAGPVVSASPGPVTDVQSAAPCAARGGRSAAPCPDGGAQIVSMPPHLAASAARVTFAASPSPPVSVSPSAAPGTTTPPATTAPEQQGTPAEQVLALINQARSQAGRPALTFSAGLDQSASAHNLLMANGCGLSHQCPGEPPIGTRETDAGVEWTSAGENIGEQGPVAASTAAIAAAAVALTQDMLNEKPPDDGHRLNILNASFAHVGIAVYRDSSGTVWLTQDFSN